MTMGMSHCSSADGGLVASSTSTKSNPERRLVFAFVARLGLDGLALVAALALAIPGKLNAQSQPNYYELSGSEYDQWWQGSKRFWCVVDRDAPVEEQKKFACVCAEDLIVQDHANRRARFQAVRHNCGKQRPMAGAPTHPPPPRALEKQGLEQQWKEKSAELDGLDSLIDDLNQTGHPDGAQNMQRLKDKLQGEMKEIETYLRR